MKTSLLLKRMMSPAIVVILIVLIVSSSCTRKPVRVSSAYREYVQAFTSGIISTRSTIKVRLTEDFIDTSATDSVYREEMFRFRPSIKGTTHWLDARTLEFCPSEPLQQDKQYTAKFFLSKAIKVPDSLSVMEFSFRTMKQEIEVSVGNLKPYINTDFSREQLTGRVVTADFAEDGDVEKVIEATQDGESLTITWSHNPKTHVHMFSVDTIRRGNSAGSVTVKWDGSPIDADNKGKTEIVVPSVNDFMVVTAEMIQDLERFILVRFSDPLLVSQDCDGLIRVGKYSGHRYTIDDNELRIYVPDVQGDNVNVTIDGAIRNVNGKKLERPWSAPVPVVNVKPDIRFAGDGCIIPSSNNFLLPFEAVNINAVDVRVIRIFEKNVLQFLQVNDISGQDELFRVGKIVLQKTIPLKGVVNYNQWNRYSIDLGELIKAEPGAIYTVKLSFKKKYSTFPCAGGESGVNPDEGLTVVSDIDAVNNKDWYYYSSYEDYSYDSEDGEDYNWNERNNPCNAAYYHDKSIRRNVFASDIGLIAKGGDGGRYNVYVTNIVTTSPENNATVKFYNFQMQPIAEVTTDGDGMAEATMKGKPFVVVAEKGKDKGYLRLTDGNSLSLSMFDVSGEIVNKGIKGFIYGERGVWRPGDSLYLTFILNDAANPLPAGHPVSMSLLNPSGQLVTRVVQQKSTGGFYAFRLVTDRNAPTGNWLAVVRVGSVSFQKNIKIETVKPNRLKIIFDFKTDRLIRDKIPDALLQVSWLTGAVAGNLKAEVNLTLTKSVTDFKNFPGYTFDYPGTGFTPENFKIFDGKLNAEGTAVIRPGINLTSMAPGVLKANFETMVFEAGGDFSVDRYSIPYYPYNSFAGISIPQESKTQRILYTDKAYTIPVANVTAEGTPVVSGTLRAEIFKLDWRWWWDDSEGGSADFVSGSNNILLDSMRVAITNGKGSFTFKTGHEDWGRYFLRVTDLKSGHMAGKIVYVDWPGYYRIPGGEKQAAAMLTLTADKEKYKPGDKMKVTFPSSKGGRALVTIESGSAVLKSFWVPATDGFTEVPVDITAEMAPNVYLFVSLLQPHAQTINDLPIRLYGVIPVLVEDPQSHLRPEIQAPAVMMPGSPVTLSVKEAGGKPMTYTIAVVDEGLLDLTRFKTPDPWSAFFAREALGVKTWDLFSMVMGAFSGELQRILSIGGDEEGNIKGSMKANRFKPMVKFLGPFELKKGEVSRHTFTMPQYIGSVRIMVVAGDKTGYGSAEKTAFVRKPLMVLGTLPRVLGPGETVKLPVSVFAMEKNIRDVSVKIIPDGFFTVNGAASTQLTFTAIGDKLAVFDLSVKEMTGVGHVKIIATSGKETAEYSVEIDIRNPNSPVSQVFDKAIPAGGSWSTTFSPIGIPGTNTASLEVSSIPPLNLEERLQYLITYPHGCIEQTTSAVFPQLYLGNLMELSPEEKASTERNINNGISMIRRFQVSNGGFSYWPGMPYADDWGTSYAGHFLLEAEKKGYTVPSGLLQAWKDYQRQKANTWVVNASYWNDDVVQAYRLFTLALAKSPETGAMNKLLERKDLTLIARWELAAAYSVAGKPEVAKRLIAQASTEPRNYQEMWYTYGSTLRDQALIVEVLCLLDMKTRAAPLVLEISKALSSASWYSTQATAFALMAVTEFSGNAKGKGLKGTWKVNNGGASSFETSSLVSVDKIPAKELKPGATLHVTNNGNSMLYSVLTLRGIPAPGQETAAANDLRIESAFQTLTGEKISGNQVIQGTSFIAVVTVTNPGIRGIYRQLVLTQVFPSGWEIMNARMSEVAEAKTPSAQFDYQDVRDDRVYTYFSLQPAEKKTFRVMLNASYLGRFYLAGTLCEAMYDHTVYARTAGNWVEVTGGE
jgi:alpha-2-macroglobulin